MKNHEISIIIPCYNSGEYLPEAIESVRTYAGNYTYEIIVIDDGSNDEKTLSVLENLKDTENITLLRQQNQGLSAARNAGCRIAKGEFLLFLDSDNTIFPEYIDLSINFLRKNPEFGVFYGQPEFIGDINSRYGFDVDEFDIDEMLINNYIDACAVVRKTAFENVGGFDEQLRCFEDYDFWLSIYEKQWKFHFCKKTLYQYRILQTSLIGSGSNDFFNQAFIRICTKHLNVLLSRFNIP